MNEAADRLDQLESEARKKPRLTEAMITAAACAHYGKKRAAAGIRGIDLTSNGVNFTFEQGFRRMWHGAWSAIEEPQP